MSWKKVAVFAAFLLAGGLTLQQAVASEQTGKQIFETLRCTSCHSIASQDLLVRGEEKADLSAVGATRSAEWVQGWLKKEEAIDGANHRPTFRGSDEELVSLSAWLATLGAE